MSPLTQLLLILLMLLVLPFLIFLCLSFIFFLVKEFLFEPLMAVMLWKKVKPTPNWETTSGIITSRVVLKKRRWYYMGSWKRKWVPDKMLYLEFPTYYAHIEILYLVGSKSFLMRPPLSFIDEFTGIFRNKAAALVAKYPSGKHIAIRYDPSNPQFASIEQSEHVIT